MADENRGGSKPDANSDLSAAVSKFRLEDARPEKVSSTFSALQIKQILIGLLVVGVVGLRFYVRYTNWPRNVSSERQTVSSDFIKNFNYADRIKRRNHKLEDVERHASVVSDDNSNYHAYAEIFQSDQMQVSVFHGSQSHLQFVTKAPEDLENVDVIVRTIVKGCEMDNRTPVDLSEDDQRLLKKVITELNFSPK